MNLYTFKDAASSKRQSLANEVEELDDEEDELEERGPRKMTGAVDGEEDEGGDKFNEAGEVIEPFNLKDERDGGHFDENMNYVWGKEQEEPDAWLANMDEATMEKSIGEAAAALKRKNDALEELDNKREPVFDREQLKAQLLQILQPGESVPAALRRLGGRKPDQRKSAGSSKSKSSSGVAASTIRDSEGFSKLTEVADGLIVLGFTNIYDLSYDALDAVLSTWQYKGLDGQIYGPFQGDQIVKWMRQGFFGSDGSSVEMRKVVAVTSTDGSYSTDENRIKRARFEEPSSVAVAENYVGSTGGTSSHQELLNDLDDDGDDSDPEATAMIKGTSKGSVSSRNQEHVLRTIAAPVYSYGSWISSSSIDFGDVGAEQDSEDEQDSQN